MKESVAGTAQPDIQCAKVYGWGTVRVTTTYDDGLDSVQFSVTDTGIGIKPEDIDRIFQEFVQIENPLQARPRHRPGIAVVPPPGRPDRGNLDVASQPGSVRPSP